MGRERTVVGGVLLARKKGFWVEERAVGACLDLIDHIGLKVDVERTGNVLAGAAGNWSQPA